jgi:hypothetical protein
MQYGFAAALLAGGPRRAVQKGSELFLYLVQPVGADYG